jgi:hypothetical protein
MDLGRKTFSVSVKLAAALCRGVQTKARRDFLWSDADESKATKFVTPDEALFTAPDT